MKTHTIRTIQIRVSHSKILFYDKTSCLSTYCGMRLLAKKWIFSSYDYSTLTQQDKQRHLLVHYNVLLQNNRAITIFCHHWYKAIFISSLLCWDYNIQDYTVLKYRWPTPLTCTPINTHDTTRYYVLLLHPYSSMLVQIWVSIPRIQISSKGSQHVYQLLIFSDDLNKSL